MAENQPEFDNVENAVTPSNRNTNNQSDGLQQIIRILSCLPCFPKYEEKPETPNINEVFFFLKCLSDDKIVFLNFRLSMYLIVLKKMKTTKQTQQ